MEVPRVVKRTSPRTDFPFHSPCLRVPETLSSANPTSVVVPDVINDNVVLLSNRADRVGKKRQKRTSRTEGVVRTRNSRSTGGG